MWEKKKREKNNVLLHSTRAAFASGEWLMCVCLCARYPAAPSPLQIEEGGMRDLMKEMVKLIHLFILMGEQITVNYGPSHLVV